LTYNIVIEVCDRNRIKSAVNARLKAARELQQMVAGILETFTATAKDV
jgi:hypothetical protein